MSALIGGGRPLRSSFLVHSCRRLEGGDDGGDIVPGGAWSGVLGARDNEIGVDSISVSGRVVATVDEMSNFEMLLSVWRIVRSSCATCAHGCKRGTGKGL